MWKNDEAKNEVDNTATRKRDGYAVCTNHSSPAVKNTTMYRPELIVGGIIGNECLLLGEMRSAWGKICSSNSMS